MGGIFVGAALLLTALGSFCLPKKAKKLAKKVYNSANKGAK